MHVREFGNSFFLLWLEEGNIEEEAQSIWQEYIHRHTYEWGEFDSAEWRESTYQPRLPDSTRVLSTNENGTCSIR